MASANLGCVRVCMCAVFVRACVCLHVYVCVCVCVCVYFQESSIKQMEAAETASLATLKRYLPKNVHAHTHTPRALAHTCRTNSMARAHSAHMRTPIT